MAKKAAVVLITESDVELAAKAYAAASYEIQGLEAEKSKEILAIEEKYKERIDAQVKAKDDAEKLISEYVLSNLPIMEGKKSRKTWGVTISHRSSPKWVLPTEKKWEDFYADLKKIDKGLITVKESLQLDVLRKDYDKYKDKLAALSISLNDEESVSVKI